MVMKLLGLFRNHIAFLKNLQIGLQEMAENILKQEALFMHHSYLQLNLSLNF